MGIRRGLQRPARLLLFVLLLATSSCSNDSATLPDDPLAQGVVLCVGDSITDSYGGLPGYPEHLAALTGRRVVNAGRTYETSAGGAAKTPALLDEHRPAALTILYGINDIQDAAAATVIVANIRLMVRAAASRGVRPIVGLVLPVREGLAGLNPAVERLNAALIAMAREEKVPTVDLYNLFLDRSELYLDAIHPNAAGRIAIAAAFAPYLDP
jgi:acyl-CoA thioesterase-1